MQAIKKKYLTVYAPTYLLYYGIVYTSNSAPLQYKPLFSILPPMKLPLFITIVMLFFSSPMHALSLKEKFKVGESGDFIVTERDKTYTIYLFRSLEGSLLGLDEISMPSHKKRKKIVWKPWLEAGAKGATSYLQYTIDIDTQTVKKCYSKTRNAYVPVEGSDSLLLTLLTLDLKRIPLSERKKIGPPQNAGPDMRKIWNPPHIINGKTLKFPRFGAYDATWPKDTTELSGKQIELYFDQKNPTFPFPYWIQISDWSNTFKMRIVDSGRNVSF